MTNEVAERALDEHRLLRDHVERLRAAARELPHLSLDERDDLVRRILEFLEGTLLPHADAEEIGLYALVEQELGDARATLPMRSDHVAIRERVLRLGATAPTDTERLQELLYGLHALISVHFWKEERHYAPLLDADSYGYEHEPALTHE